MAESTVCYKIIKVFRARFLHIAYVIRKLIASLLATVA